MRHTEAPEAPESPEARATRAAMGRLWPRCTTAWLPPVGRTHSRCIGRSLGIGMANICSNSSRPGLMRRSLLGSRILWLPCCESVIIRAPESQGYRQKASCAADWRFPCWTKPSGKAQVQDLACTGGRAGCVAHLTTSLRVGGNDDPQQWFDRLRNNITLPSSCRNQNNVLQTYLQAIKKKRPLTPTKDLNIAAGNHGWPEILHIKAPDGCAWALPELSQIAIGIQCSS